MLRFLILPALLLLSCNPKAQNSSTNENELKIQFSLPKKLKEVSGITLSKDKNTIWLIEDRGNKNAIYGVSSNGDLVAKIPVENAENTDWEDIISDTQGNIYIGDFGNNDNNRQDLAILKTDLKDNKQTVAKVIQTTKFHYQGQTEFPPKKSNLLYDCEAFVEMNGNFYLFTKNRSKGFDGTFLVFQIPNKEGNFEAKLIGTLKLDGGYNDAAITSATINSTKDKIVLLTHKNVHVLTGFTASNFNDAKIEKIPLHHNSQKEAIVFLDDKTLMIADEKAKDEGGNVYTFSL
ncbi:SdiA-regulated domain-containing protein [Chryseobacterium culicis]|uniref:SdiA-regulated domain-containing protein n=1 Tax=Chryseobacterium culicis TaxID=680127 RepID=UPI00289E3486|nr:SdiA-regulated domain-containing protein [Chryseobacterium culicis]